MKNIAIKEAIASGEWFQYLEENVKMKIRIISIRNVDLAEIDDIHEVDKNLPLNNGKLLMLSAEIINMSRFQNDPPKILLIDQDDFQFVRLDDSHLRIWSQFAKMHQLFVPDLIPKLKYKVDYLFLVPKEDAKYYINTHPGTINAI